MASYRCKKCKGYVIIRPVSKPTDDDLAPVLGGVQSELYCMNCGVLNRGPDDLEPPAKGV